MIKSDPQNPDFCHSVFEFDDQTIGRSDFFSEPDNKSDDIIKSRTSFFATKKTFLKIQQEWKKKPSFFLKREKHSKQKYYSILFLFLNLLFLISFQRSFLFPLLYQKNYSALLHFPNLLNKISFQRLIVFPPLI